MKRSLMMGAALAALLAFPALGQVVNPIQRVPALPPPPVSGQVPPPPAVTSVPVTPPAAANIMPMTASPIKPADPAAPPPSKRAVKQALRETEGDYPQMDRPAAGGQIQPAWDVSDHHSGVYPVKLCTDCVYKVRLREFMVTTLVLPDDAVIAGSPDLGDAAGFEVVQKSLNKIAVRPKMAGVDTNLNVYTRSGRVYPFYLRSESYNSVNVPDILVKVTGLETPPPLVAVVDEKVDDGKKKSRPAKAIESLTNAPAAPTDFVRNIPFDPSKLHGWDSYKLWGDSDLKPETVFRDDQFTYIQYGDSWDSKELPTAYVVVDGVDELVNTRVQGNTFIVEAVTGLISLKSGKKFLCVQYTGEKP